MSADDTRLKMLLAAGPVFAERGYERATVREICAAAGVNLAAINYYFGDKKRLYIETVKLARQRRAEEVPLPERGDDVPAAERLRDHVRTIVGRMVGLEDAPWEARLLTSEIIEPTEACRELIEEHFRPHLEQLTEVIAELLPAGVTKQTKQRFVFSLIGQCFFYRAASGVVSLLIPPEELNPHFSVEAISDHIWATMLGALSSYRSQHGCSDRGTSSSVVRTVTKA